MLVMWYMVPWKPTKELCIAMHICITLFQIVGKSTISSIGMNEMCFHRSTLTRWGMNIFLRMRSIWDSLFLGNRSLPREFNNVRSNLTYMNSTQGVFELTWMWLGMWCVGHYKRVLAIFGVNLSTTIVLKTHNMSLLYYNNKNLR